MLNLLNIIYICYHLRVIRMSKELNIVDKTYFYDCNVKGEIIEYLLYDSNETWIATKTKEEVLQTLQLLNKRIKYDMPIAFDTLQNMLPDSATWIRNDNQSEASNVRERVLKLKYRVKECPFHFEWRLKQQNSSLMIQLSINQVESLVDMLPAKIEELLQILQRKEHEIKQYRIEYGSLRRSTLATNNFDVKTFREQYAATDMNVKSLQRIVARWRSEHGEAETVREVESSPSNKGSPTNIIKQEEKGKSSSSVGKSVQESPRSRKRKALYSYKMQMMRSLQSGKKELEYESQSQTLSDIDPQDTKQVKKVRENVEDVGNVIVAKVASAIKGVNISMRTATCNSPETPTNSIVEDGSTPTKEVASKVRKSSPRVEKRPNTRQRRRECEMSVFNSNELELADTTCESVSTVPNESVGLTKNSISTKAISPPNIKTVKHKIVTSAHNLAKPQFVKRVEQSKNDLSSYVDSMLNQLEALDKELRG